MEYIIVGLGVILCLFLIGFLMKRKYFNEVDRFEAWKIDLMNRPVLDEMAKVKKLNMTGQTEELFERWRKEWDDIVTSELPDIEEFLLDAEDYTDKLRFGKAKESLASIDNKLTSIENKIKNILEELNELVGSEEKNRNEIELLKEQYRDCRKNLLAHRHSFGKAEKGLEDQLNEILQEFEKFDEKTESGNYLEAREIVLGIQLNLDEIVGKMELIPQLIHDCQLGIPAQMNELKEGCREMVEQGYILDHLGTEEELEEIQKQLSEFQALIDETKVAEIQHGIEQLKEKMDHLFDLLEKEALAKQFIKKNENELNQLFHTAVDENDKIQEEIFNIQQSYELSDQELDAHVLAEGNLEQLVKRYQLLIARLEQGETAYSFLSDELVELKQELEACNAEQQEFKEKLNALRKDEMAAREKVRELSKKTTEMLKLITKSNLPGLSQSYKYLLEDTKESIQNVADKLEQKPLNIPTVQQYLEIAELTVEKLASSTEEIVDNVKLAERLIQYGNRYRSSYPSVAKGLKEAEKAFRNYDYRQALEEAAAAIEEVEPGALKKIENIFIETNA
ncbi:MAG: septation ring formation regulator EzrA [Bacillota bacterium]